MKNLIQKFSIFVVGLMFIAPACTDLTEELYSEVTPDNFFQTEEEFIDALASANEELAALTITATKLQTLIAANVEHIVES